jgi:hypothetical protein
MAVADELPTMEDTALATLHTNAERLLEAGTSAQQTAAAALMPSIKAELAARAAAQAAAQIDKRAEALAVRRANKAKPRDAAAN